MLGKYYDVTPVKHSSRHVTPCRSRLQNVCSQFSSVKVPRNADPETAEPPSSRNVHLVRASITVNMLLLL